jgi:5-dehydro-2-deoxygluconokinase
MSEYLVRHPDGFQAGLTSITTLDDVTGIHFAILKLKQGEEFELTSDLESACLLMHGKCEFHFNEQIRVVERTSCFDEDPYAIHLAATHKAKIKALTDAELSLSQVKNPASFPTEFFDSSNMLESERRGKGLLDDTAYRIVRTIFDSRNRPQAKLVLGEVINAPGRWSSYPPHHHMQPEIYHYRFTEPQGYGHAECGDHVFKVKQFDTYKILDNNDHSQVSAPGYGMYYIWVIRHLDDQIYKMPTFTDEHNWTRTDEANSRVWSGLEK